MKGPDPSEFESEFAIEDEDSRKSGPSKSQVNQNGGSKTMQETASQKSGQETDETSTSAGEASALPDLPADVRDKLRRLEKYESRYHGIHWTANRFNQY